MRYYLVIDTSNDVVTDHVLATEDESDSDVMRVVAMKYGDDWVYAAMPRLRVVETDEPHYRKVAPSGPPEIIDAGTLHRVH